MATFTDKMRITVTDMARTIRSQVAVEASKRPDLHVQLMAIASTALEVEETAAGAESLSATQLISSMETLRDLVQDLTLLTGA